ARHRAADEASLRERAFREFDGGQTEAAEESWAQARALTQAIDLEYASAERATEAALALSPGEERPRADLADTLLEQAIRAERDDDPLERDALLARLAIHDVGGARRRAFAAPAIIAVEIVPEG